MLPMKLRQALALLLLAAPLAAAQTASTPSDPVDFASGQADNGVHAATILKMGITPRAIALGEAMGAIGNDPSDIFYNAAGLALVRSNAFFVTGSERFGDTQLGAVAVTFPTTLATFAVGVRAFNAGTVEQSESNVLVGGRCRAFQLALEGGGAMELHPHLLVGGSVFYAQETLCQDSRGTIGISAGVLFPDVAYERLTLGAGLRNWGTEVTFDVDGFRPPLMGYLAGSYDLFRQRNLMQTPLLFKGQPIILDAKVAAQWNFENNTGNYTMFGIEGTVNGVAIGRIGYQFGDDNRKGLALGAGVNVGQFRLEYAFRNRKNAGASFWSFDPIGDEHHVGATFFWGGAATNVPVAPLIVPIDTAAINAAVREAVARELDRLRPLLDSLRNAQVEIRREEADLVARYLVPIHFDFDEVSVRDSDVVLLGQIAEVIRQAYPTALVTIEGFSDPAGSEEYNLRLSRRRAEAVKRVMVDRFGLPERQFRTVGYGEQPRRQVAPGARRDEPGAMQNRRVSFTIDATRHY